MIIVKSSVDSSDQLGSMFGLQQTCSSIARGISPTFVSALFAFSIDRQVMGGYFVWVVLTLISLAAVPLSMRVRDVPAARSATKYQDDDDGVGESVSNLSTSEEDSAVKRTPRAGNEQDGASTPCT